MSNSAAIRRVQKIKEPQNLSERVTWMDLMETYGRESLPLLQIGLGSILTKAAKSAAKQESRAERILKPWAEGLFNRLNAIKFLSYVGDDGFPAIIPLIQCQAADSTRLVFSPLAYHEELSVLQQGSSVAVFGLTMDMEDVLVRGVLPGLEGTGESHWGAWILSGFTTPCRQSPNRSTPSRNSGPWWISNSIFDS
jgi:hypothetical protein